MSFGEVAQLKIRELTIEGHSGYVKIPVGKGRQFRVIPLNATVRRSLKNYLDMRVELNPESSVFISKKGSSQSELGLQNIIQSLIKRSNITRIQASVHTLRHTFARNYIKANPGYAVSLSRLLGHESFNTNTEYTNVSEEDLLNSVERMRLHYPTFHQR